MTAIDYVMTTDNDLPEVRPPGFWDGVTHSYIPQGEITVSDSLKLHRAYAEDVDPVTYEVIRYSLLNINLEHGMRLQKLAVSQILISSRDYQTTIMTEVGDVLMVGPNVQYFSNSASLSVKNMMETRSEDPGIQPGDMWLSNDVFVGAPHQPDTCLAAPVFIGDELFCWVSNTLHYEDLGGSMPGSFCFNARDAWDEPLNWPPTRLVENGKIRKDIEQVFIRQSRFPHLVQMDMRASVAANEATRQQVVQLVERYGAEAVKAVMHGILDAGERQFRERIGPIPEGTWSHRAYTEGAVSGDRNIYTYQVNITKTGDRLIVDNRGTDPQAGAINIGFAAFSGGVLAAIMGHLASDMAGVYGGAYRCVEFRPEPGLLNCADFPAACSPSGVVTTEVQITAAATACSKMLACSPETKALILGPTMFHAYNFSAYGLDGNGAFFLMNGNDIMMGSFAGQPEADGWDQGGHWWIPAAIGPNVEDSEARKPLLTLWRRMLPAQYDGAGRQRGGVGFTIGGMLRGSRGAETVMTMGESFPKGQGLFGGNPGGRAAVDLLYGTNVDEVFAAGRMPSELDELESHEHVIPGFKSAFKLADGDVWEWTFPGMPGYGDPLRRKPEAVLADLQARLTDEATAERVHGVVIRDGRVDDPATEAARFTMRRDRLDGAEPSELVEPSDAYIEVGEMLRVVNGRWWCNGADLGPVRDNYKLKSKLLERKVREISPEFENDDHDMSDRIVFREFICPVTGYRIDTEIAQDGDPVLHDIRLQG